MIKPGQQKTFYFNVKAPASPGNYNFALRMVREGVEWFGAFTPNAVVQVRGNVASLENLLNGKAQFITDQQVVPLQGPNLGHREAFAVNRPDLGPNTILLYHRCFVIDAGHPEIAVARSDDGGASFGPSKRIITLLAGYFSVTPSVLKLGNTWWMVYEEGALGACYASSPDGLSWTRRGRVFPDSEGASTPSLYEYNGTIYVFYAWFQPNSDKHLTIRYRKGLSLTNLGGGYDLFSPAQSGWGTKSVSMPRIVRQVETNGRVAHYMFFEGATDNLFCSNENNNKYGWGVARSYDLVHWNACGGNPIMINKGGCGLDMPNPFISDGGSVFVFHTSANLKYIMREQLRLR